MREDLKMAVTIVLFNNVTPTSIKTFSPSALCSHLLVLHVDLYLVIPLHAWLVHYHLAFKLLVSLHKTVVVLTKYFYCD